MYICTDCGYEFSTPKKHVDRHGLNSPPYEEFYVCPACNSENFHKQNTSFCRFCGTRLKNGAVDYCSAKCRRRGIKAWLKQKLRRKQLISSCVYTTVRSVDAYNRKHGTKLSYGQYVALVEGRKK